MEEMLGRHFEEEKSCDLEALARGFRTDCLPWNASLISTGLMLGSKADGKARMQPGG